MDKNLVKKIFAIVVFILGMLVFLVVEMNKSVDDIKYNGKKYILLEYNMDIFTYNHNNSDNMYYEEDVIHPISHEKWNVVYFNGDLFVIDNQVKKATKYYNNDQNYNWYIIFEDNEEELKKTLSVSEEELVYLYNIENNKDKITITFNDIDMFVDILKISKDGLIQGIVNLVQVDGNWYYKTEIMTDDDKEYVIKIQDSLNEKINNLVSK